MVHLVLSSTKGNQGLRYFPHSGYLGLTPVKVEGIVKTKLDDDLKTLQAKSITISVRCYEARLGRVSVVHSNILVDHTTTLWSKPDDADYAPIGDLEFPFKIVVPTKTAGFSTAVFVDYRCSWRVEAIINHIPISGIGSRQIRHFELPLVRYDLPPYQPTPASPPPLADLPSPSSPSSVKSPYARSPRFQFSINPPTDPIGPHDLVSIPVQLLPLDPSISIRSVSASIDRRITLCPDPPTPPTSPTSNGTSSLAILRASPSPSPRSCSPASSYKEPSAFPNDSNPSITSFDSSASTITPDTLAPSHSSAALLSSDVPMEPSSSTSPSQHPPSKIISNVITTAEASGSLTRDEKGVWSRILTLQWPPPKPNSRWATGETIQSELVNVQFFARVKVVISSSWGGNETFELPEKEILVVSTNISERQTATAKYNEVISDHMRSKSKSPRRKRRERDEGVPPPPVVGHHHRGEHSHKISTLSTPATSSSSKSKSTPRRPHTSSGTREKGSSSHSRRAPAEPKPFSRPRDDRGHELETEQPDESGVKRRATRTTDQNRLSAETTPKASIRNSFIFSPRISPSTSGSSATTSESTSTSSTTTTAVESSSDSSVTGSTSSCERGTRVDVRTSPASHRSSQGGMEEMKAWEEELTRIEVQSRRTKDLGCEEKASASARFRKGLNLRRLLPVIGNGKA